MILLRQLLVENSNHDYNIGALKVSSDIYDRNQLQEDPDVIFVDDDERLHYSAIDVVSAVACIGHIKIKSTDKPMGKSWVAGTPEDGDVFLNGECIGEGIYTNTTHNDLIDLLYEDLDIDYYRGVNMRLYHWKNQYYAVFWDEISECRQWQKQIFDCLKFFVKGKLENIKCQFDGMQDDEFITFEKAFRTRKKIKRTKSKAEAALAQKLHLMGPKQKVEFLKKMGAMKPDKIHIAADKLGMTVAELRELLGLSVAEVRKY